MTLLSSACSRSNNHLLGRVETTVDCCRTSVPPRQMIDPATWQFTPCPDADILIRNEELLADGKSYGHIQPADAILIDLGAVSINAAK